MKWLFFSCNVIFSNTKSSFSFKLVFVKISMKKVVYVFQWDGGVKFVKTFSLTISRKLIYVLCKNCGTIIYRLKV